MVPLAVDGLIFASSMVMLDSARRRVLLRIFVQNVWEYSPLKAGIAFLPLAVVITAASGIASQLVNGIGARR